MDQTETTTTLDSDAKGLTPIQIKARVGVAHRINETLGLTALQYIRDIASPVERGVVPIENLLEMSIEADLEMLT